MTRSSGRSTRNSVNFDDGTGSNDAGKTTQIGFSAGVVHRSAGRLLLVGSDTLPLRKRVRRGFAQVE
jgi:ABC-type multidrug transport system ATPase subunit